MNDNKNNRDPYSNLASVIENTISAVSTALDSAAKGVSGAWNAQKQSEYFKNLHLNVNQTPKQDTAAETRAQTPQNKQAPPAQPRVTRKKKKLRIDRKGLSIPGAVFLGGGLCLAACAMAEDLFIQPAFFDFILTGGFGIGAIAVFISGIRSNALYKIACRYGRVIGNFPEYSISALARVMQCTKSKVQKDLERLLEKGYFGKNAYLDYGGERIVIDPDEARITVQKPAEEPVQKPETEPSDEYDVWLRKIKEANQKIDDSAVTLCVNRIHLYTEKIFEFIRVHPEDVGQIRTFMNYYLPMTLKLLQSYDMLEEAGVAGENMRTTKKNIEETLETLAGAYRQQLDNLYSAQAMDISADIDVLEQMLRRDGLDHQYDFGSGSATATAQNSEEI